MVNKGFKILLLGATGYTGGLIAELFLERGIDFWAYGRNLQKLEELKLSNKHCVGIEIFTIGSGGLLPQLSPRSIVVNCIGPFNVYGQVVVEDCLTAGATYIDITGEQEIVKSSFDNNTKKALEIGALILHSMSFESALSDLLLLLSMKALGANNYQSFNTYYLLNTKQMSPGTRISLKVANAFDSYSLWQGDLLDPAAVPFTKNQDAVDPYKGYRVAFPEPIFAKAHGNIAAADAYFLLDPMDPMGLFFSSKANLINKSMDVSEIIERHNRTNVEGPSKKERLLQSFEIYTYLTAETTGIKQILRGFNMYGLTAELVVLAVLKVLDEGSNDMPSNVSAGVLTPGQFLSNQGIEWLQQHPQLQITTELFNRNSI